MKIKIDRGSFLAMALNLYYYKRHGKEMQQAFNAGVSLGRSIEQIDYLSDPLWEWELKLW